MRTETQELSLEELRGLYELVRSLHGAQGLEGVVAGFLEKLNEVVPFDSCAVIFGDEGSANFEITHAAGEHAASLVGRKIVSGEGISGWVVANRHPFCNTDPLLDLPHALAAKFDDYLTLAVFPIVKGKDLFGAVALYSRSLSKYDATHQRLLSEACGLFALALSAAQPVASRDRRFDEEEEVGRKLPAHIPEAHSHHPLDKNFPRYLN